MMMTTLATQTRKICCTQPIWKGMQPSYHHCHISTFLQTLITNWSSPPSPQCANGWNNNGQWWPNCPFSCQTHPWPTWHPLTMWLLWPPKHSTISFSSTQDWLIALMMTTVTTLKMSYDSPWVSLPCLLCKQRCCAPLMCCLLNSTTMLTCSLLLPLAPKSPIPSPLYALLLPLITQTAICHKTTPQPHKKPKTQIPPWLPCHMTLCNTLAPVSKFSPYKKCVPSKPPSPVVVATWWWPKPRIKCGCSKCNGFYHCHPLTGTSVGLLSTI